MKLMKISDPIPASETRLAGSWTATSTTTANATNELTVAANLRKFEQEKPIFSDTVFTLILSNKFCWIIYTYHRNARSWRLQNDISLSHFSHLVKILRRTDVRFASFFKAIKAATPVAISNAKLCLSTEKPLQTIDRLVKTAKAIHRT